MYRSTVWFLCCLIFLLINPSLVHSQTVSQRTIDSLVCLYETTDQNALKPLILNKISFDYVNIDPKTGLSYAERALAMAKAMHAEEDIAHAYNNIANSYAMMSQLDSTLGYYTLALQVYEKINNRKGIANVLGNIGNIHYFKGSYAHSLEYQFKALAIFEELQSDQGLINTWAAIGNIYMMQKNFTLALKYDSLALEKTKQVGDVSGTALMYGNLANIFDEQKKTEDAIACFQKAIAIYEQLNYMAGLGRNLSNLGTLYQKQGEHLNALTYLHKALICFKQARFGEGISMALGNIGMSYYASYRNALQPGSKNNFVQASPIKLAALAKKYLKESVAVGEEIGSRESLSFYYEKLSLLYEETGETALALAFNKKYHETKDSVHGKESKVLIEQLTTERELALKNKQIELDRLAVEKKRNERSYFCMGILLLALSVVFIYRNFVNQKKSNIALAHMNEQIAGTNEILADKNQALSLALQHLQETQDQLIESERQKEIAVLRSKISQDIHDDISSGLTKIAWLAELFKQKTSHLSHVVDMGILEKMNAFAHETVTKLGEIIWCTNPERDNLPSLLSYMRSFLHKYLEETPFQCSVEFPDTVPPLSIHPEVRRNLFLVFKEGVHNAVKYSNASELSASFVCDDHQFTLKISDNGNGFEQNIVQGGGNGITNMKRRMAAIGGQVEILSKVGKGTQLCFYAPIAS